MFKLVQLLSSESVKNMNNHGKYIKNSLNLRNDMLPKSKYIAVCFYVWNLFCINMNTGGL